MVADAPREKQPKLTALMDSARDEVLACVDVPREHRPQIAGANLFERVDKEIKRRSDVVGVFPDDHAIVLLVGALMPESDDEWTMAWRAIVSACAPRGRRRHVKRHTRLAAAGQCRSAGTTSATGPALARTL
ncbi:transposase [Rhodovulum sulfidophilum]|nr:transposase [Rhodovulum sulfidophilum]